MTNILIGLLGVLIATNEPAALSNLVTQETGLKVAIPAADDPVVDKELEKLMDDDDAAVEDVSRWLRENQQPLDKGGNTPPEILTARINARLDPVHKSYQDFLKLHPNHARAHLAYGSFLENIHEDDAALAEIQKANDLDPKDPATWNDLANLYTHIGPASKVIEYCTKAVDLNSNEPVYLENLATAVYLYRQDARQFYGFTNDQQVFDKALGFYVRAQHLDPTNFALATDLAQSYYGIKPTRTEEALNAWTNALKIAGTDLEREGVHIHLARFKLNADRFQEAHQELEGVTNSALMDLKQRLLRNLDLREKERLTNAAPPKAHVEPLENK